MYKNIEETAKNLKMPVEQVEKYVLEGRIKSIYVGEQVLINQDQFELYFKQLEKLKEEITVYWNSPLPEDRDIKEED